MIKKLFLCLFGFTLILSNYQLFAEIIEANEISLAQKYIQDRSLVLFNVTGTLYEPSTRLADNLWRIYFTERVKNIVSNPDDAQNLIDKIKNKIVVGIPKKAVEEITPQFIADLQYRKVTVLGITKKFMATSYADNFGEITSKHLKSIGVDMEKTLDYLLVAEDKDNNEYDFAFGLIFTNKKPEGPVLLSFLKRLNFVPSNIVMIDNSFESLKNVEANLALTQIPFTGLIYTRGDTGKKEFDPQIGTIEFFEFIDHGKIISDEEALKIKAAHPEMDYESMLDSYILANITVNKE